MRPPRRPSRRWAAHSYDRTGPEFNGGSFSDTLMYGYDNRQIAFLEPASTPDYLAEVAAMGNPAVNKTIRQPALYALPQHTALFPTTYQVAYNPAEDASTSASAT